MDPRETPFNGRVAHVSLRGKVDAADFVEGEVRRVTYGVTDLRDAIHGNRLRQLNHGEAFRVLDEAKNHAFGIRECDGYVGWVRKAFLSAANAAPTHKVIAQRAPFRRSTNVKDTELPAVEILSYGALVEARQHPNPTHQEEAAAEGWLMCVDRRGEIPESRYVRLSQIAPVEQQIDDPAAVAELFLHTPYLWGGNTAFGIDCSGLVQAALLACAIPCPGDSDQQEARVGTALRPDAPLQRNDLIFWSGHVALALDAERIIHANAHHMAVAIEPLAEATARIVAQGGGPVTSRRRP
ncbi:MAG: NlpC/P60 family protein [Paracoccaceae bacterium]|nr:NlpC/P60 family protein [Paracoccaceae bacterium]